MEILLIALNVLLALTAILLITIIMLQGSQDSDAYGPSSASKMHHMKMLGPAHAPNLLEKITGSLAVLLIVLVLASSYVTKQRYAANYQSTDTLQQVQTYMVDVEDTSSEE